MVRRVVSTILLLVLFSTIAFAANPGDYVTGNTDVDVDNLLSLMTLEEKIGQLTQFTGINDQFRTWIKEGKIGSLFNIKGAENVNTIQRVAVEGSRLGIPIIFGLDVIHGYRTITPIPLGEVASWDPKLVEQSARMAAIEATAAGINWTFAPMVDIARDARWGRISEGAGEDPYLGSVMAAARVRGFQGDNLKSPSSIAACAKHFAAYGAAVAGKDYNTTDMSLNQLHNIYLPPFKAACEAGVLTLMCAFNDLNGIPCSAHEYLLDEVLRKEWGFQGFVVSDWRSILQMQYHGNVAGPVEAAINSLSAGVDMEMVSDLYMKHIAEQVLTGQIPEVIIDEAVRRILRVKFEIGLFENPYVDPEREKHEILTPANRAFARELASKSIVLLKNDRKILPLKKNIKSIALIGPLVKEQMAPLGWWSCDGRKEDVVTVHDGIKNALPPNVIINYAEGCDILKPGTKGIASAVEAAKKSDEVVVVVGEPFDWSGEGGSRAFIGLPGSQLELVKAIHETGKKMVLLVIAGRPLALAWCAENVPSILYAWQLGVESGNAIADILFGDVNPGGKLPATLPRVTGQEPIYYNYKNSGRPPSDDRFTNRYVDLEIGPQYPFGYGLSYSTFEFDNLKLSKTKIKPFEEIIVTAEITNTGKVAGDEIAQLYIRDLVGSITRPVKELKGFQRISLNPGEMKMIEFILNYEDLSFYDDHGRYIIEPGEFMVWIGPNSVEGLHGKFEIIE